MSAGDGYKYLLRTVAAGDGDRSLSTPLTRYYAEAGTPPGRWLGSGVTGLGHGELAPGAQVSEAQLQLLVGMGRDPVTGDPLGRAYPVSSVGFDGGIQVTKEGIGCQHYGSIPTSCVSGRSGSHWRRGRTRRHGWGRSAGSGSS
ncbi:relaxase domain-containing protein [Tessaracoccus sp. MC1679]|uniref:relaxase domain-containing protein n=1 Tax=Tessaracoccus sp. MC1679 TaxID=2760313 RepID=UPI002104891B|nr:relaxase domain-containing protein [Tessaracoccus sp. MC1679]